MTIVYLDVETTGLHPGRRPWEVALIVESEDGQVDEYCWQIADVDLSDADPHGLSVGGFRERYDADSELEFTASELAVAIDVCDLTWGATIVAANPTFDAVTLDAMLRRHKLLPMWHYRLIDVSALTAGHLGRIVGGLSDCADALNVDYTDLNLHTALDDAQLARRIFKRCIPAVPS